MEYTFTAEQESSEIQSGWRGVVIDAWGERLHCTAVYATQAQAVEAARAEQDATAAAVRACAEQY